MVLVGCGSSGAGGGLADGGSGVGGTGAMGGVGGAPGGQGGTAGSSGGQGGTAGSSGGAAGSVGHTVSGSVAIVNAPAQSSTTVILADPSFQPLVPKTSPPAGLAAAGVTSSWAIAGVPDGKYLVLVAYENDGLVAESASLETVQVAGADTVATTTKVTEALAILGPEGNVSASGLTFSWKSESSVDYYDVALRDQTGKLIWQGQTPGLAGASQISLPYEGPALPTGSPHQFRVTAYANGVAITRSEDLRGVFTLSTAP